MDTFLDKIADELYCLSDVEKIWYFYLKTDPRFRIVVVRQYGKANYCFIHKDSVIVCDGLEIIEKLAKHPQIFGRIANPYTQ